VWLPSLRHYDDEDGERCPSLARPWSRNYPQPKVTAGDVYRALWRYSALIIVLTAACIVTAWYVASQQTKTYEAWTLMRIEYPSSSDPGSRLDALEAGERLATTYASIIESGALDRDVARIVAPRLREPGASGVELSASEVEGLEMLRVASRSANPVTAAVTANAVPQALRGLVQQNDDSRESIVVLRAATTPSSAVDPQIGLTVAVAAVLALIFNGALALLLELFRDRLPEPDELEEVAEHPILATVPALRLGRLPHEELKPPDPRGEVLTTRQTGGRPGPEETGSDG
jgi:capsular polysaccharide biosynthesis protein